MSQALDTARQTLLAPAGLGERELDTLFGQILTHRADYADLYFQYSRHESWSLEEGQVKSGPRWSCTRLLVRGCSFLG